MVESTDTASGDSAKRPRDEEEEGDSGDSGDFEGSDDDFASMSDSDGGEEEEGEDEGD